KGFSVRPLCRDAFGQHEDRTRKHAYEPTREAAMAAFAKSWRRVYEPMPDVRRREFITLLGSAAAAWPLAARAQQGERMRRIGLFTNLAADDAEAQARNAAFLQALQQLGWTGNNVRIDFRFGAGDAERNRKYASELVALAPDVIVATGSPVVEP